MFQNLPFYAALNSILELLFLPFSSSNFFHNEFAEFIVHKKIHSLQMF